MAETKRFSLLGAAAMVAALTVVLGQKPEAPAASATGAGARARDTASAAPWGAHVGEAAGPGEGLLREHLGAPSDSALCPTARCDLDVLVATVPDPHDSHLDWMYDASVESLRRAFEVSGYVLDRFWMPGSRDSVLAPLLRVHVPLRDSLPSAMLFRRSAGPAESLRLLYLVGESPTAGVQARSLRTALAEREGLLERSARWSPRASRPPIRIVGPTFSGTAPSLGTALRRWQDAHGRRDSVAVLSGAATSGANLAVLADAARRISFGATVHTESEYEAALLHDVLRPLGIDAGQVAILEESSTSYGQDSSGARGVMHVPLPMYVSRARDAFLANPGATDAEGRLPGERRPGRIPLSLREQDNPRANPPAFSELTAPVVEITMAQIIETLRAQGVRAVGLRFTDVRDKLFLGEEIRKHLRDVQLFTFETNALYLRPEYARSLNGMLVISSYPLILESQWWMRDTASAPPPLAFSSDAAQGVFNAALLQVDSTRRVLDYGVPGATPALRRPPVWITAVGTRSFLPLMVHADTASRYVRAAGPAYTAPLEGDSHPVNLLALAGCLLFGVLSLSLTLRYPTLSRGRFRRYVPVLPFVGGRGLLAPRTGDGADAVPPQAAGAPTPAVAGVPAALPSSASAAPAASADGRYGGRQLAAYVRAVPRELWGRSAAVGRWMFPVTPSNLHPDELERTVKHASLLLHRELYNGLRFIALAAMGMPLMAVLWLGGQRHLLLGLGSAVVYGFWGIAFGCAVTYALRIAHGAQEIGKTYACRPGWSTTPEGRLWMMEIFVRAVVVVLGIVYAALVLWFVRDILALQAYHPFRARLFYHRAVQLDGGLSPLVPLIVSAMGFAAWCTWHLFRIEQLTTTTPYEADMLYRRDAAHEKQASAVRAARRALFLLIPQESGFLLLAVILALVAALWWNFGSALDSIVFFEPDKAMGRFGRLLHWAAVMGTALALAPLLRPSLRRPYALAVVAALLGWGLLGPASFLERRWAGAQSFDLLLRLSVIGSLVGTVWAVYRFQAAWGALRQALIAIERTPLAVAFRRVPARVSQVAQLSLLDPGNDGAVAEIAEKQWAYLRAIYLECRGAFHAMVASPELARRLDLLLVRRSTWATRVDFCEGGAAGTRFGELLDVLEHLWLREPAAEKLARLRLTEPQPAPAEGAEGRAVAVAAEPPAAGLYASLPPAVQPWMRTAEDFAATQVVAYIDWTLDHLRRLALFLFVSLMLTTALLSSYPFATQSVVKVFFLVVLLGTVATMLLVLTQMNRDVILSRIAGTTPGQVTWDSSFIFNVVLVGALPLIVFVGSEFQVVRDIGFAWLGPVMKALGGA